MLEVVLLHKVLSLLSNAKIYMQSHSDEFPDWENEAREAKEFLGNKINRMSKGTIEKQVELNYLAKILFDLYFDAQDAKQEAQGHPEEPF